jgi:cobalt-zinc-cadmium efflux system membrane fusion protein
MNWTVILVSLLALGCREGKVEPNARAEAEDEHAGEEKEEGHDPGVIDLTPEQVAAAGIAIGKVERRSVAGAIEATAEIQPTGDGLARVGARVAGRVTAFKAGAGDPVTRGQVLAVIDSPELGRAKGDYLAAFALAKVARDTADRERALFERQISSERDWRQAEAEAVKARAEKDAAENRLHTMGLADAELARVRAETHYSSTTTVTSPIDGLVIERPVTLGEMVDPGTTLFTVMDPREVWVLVDVFERDLPQVRVGQTAVARVAAYPEREFTGKVASVGSVVESKTRTVKVRVVLPNQAGELKPGMFARVLLAGTTGDPHEGLFVPAAAVQREGEDRMVFVQRAANQFERRLVDLGVEAGDWAEVKKGLVEGEVVVTTGAFLLKSELQKAELGGGHGH